MGLQFVDFNADGITDIVTATYDGSPWVALGSKEGFQQPSLIKDKDGKRVILAMYWDYDAKKWSESDRAGVADKEVHCISAAAFDWDADGDFDLLLGGYSGDLWLQMNEGSNKEPKFTGQNKRVMIGDKPLDAGDKISSPRLVDWDKDGLTDIIVGTFGDAWGAGEGGGIKWFRNAGKKGAPAFEAPKTIIENSKKDAKDATRPDAACYVDVVDFDGDGDLDLVVGGYSIWAGEKAKNKMPGAENRKPFVWVYLQTGDKTKPVEAAKPEASKTSSADK